MLGIDRALVIQEDGLGIVYANLASLACSLSTEYNPNRQDGGNGDGPRYGSAEESQCRDDKCNSRIGSSPIGANG